LLDKLLKPKDKPWSELEKNFELKLSCEDCGVKDMVQYETVDGLLLCIECAEANDRRARFKQEEEEWEK
jgi:hypothetical protein